MKNNDNGRVIFYKNKKRNEPEKIKSNIPQYQELGITPSEYKSSIVPEANVKVATTQQMTTENPRVRKVGLRQPYSAVIPSPLGRDALPNVGNNIEQTWSGVDGDVTDDNEIDPNHTMIDNNDMIFYEDSTLSSSRSESSSDLQSILEKMEEGGYLLLVDGVPICSGSQQEVENQSQALVFGEHELCEGHPVSVDNLTIIKKIKIKVGLFLENF
jgi:hypothetical protein